MIYRILAETVLLAHFTFILFVIFGGLLTFRWRKAAWVHLPCLAWGAVMVMAGWVCPLTPLENSLRRRAGLEGYDTGFIEHYLLPVVYPQGMTFTVQIVLGVMLLGFNIFVYLWWLARRRRRS
jgi:hypothetical protein